MRMALIATSAVALAAAGDAGAQRMTAVGPGADYPAPPARVAAPAPGQGVVPVPRAGWGRSVDGRWWAGANAPGGWRGYRRLERGAYLPGYWQRPDFAVGDWSSYGLGEPPAGYGWTRYYDDAVLIDGRGRVQDRVDGVDWDGAGYGAPYPPPNTVQPTYGQSTYPPAPRYSPRRDGGGGTADYAIDRSYRHRVPVAPRRPFDAAPYGEGRYGDGPGARYPPPPPAYAPPPADGVWRSPDGGTTVTTTSVGGYAGGSTTVVTVRTAPVVTTTTEIVEDHVTWSRPRPARHKWVRRPVCHCR